MAKIHIRQRDNQGHKFGLYTGKTCLVYGSRSDMYAIARAIREKRKAGKVER